MAMLPLAFSIHNFISSTGADAGFAAIIGLAVLILLYFAHARETANLREEAALLTQRLQQAEARVLQLSHAQAGAAPSARVAEEASSTLLPFAPAGMAAPALGAATRVVPVAETPVQPESAEITPEPAAAPVAAMALAGVAASAAASPAPAPSPLAARAPAPPAVAGGGEPADAPANAPSAAPVLPPATSAGGNGTGRAPIAPPARSAPGARPGELAASRGIPSAPRQLPPLQPQKRRSRLGRGVAIALAALVAVAAAVVVFALTSAGSPKSGPAAASTTNAPGPAHSTTAPGFKPSTVTVAVLNGTSTNQLAHRIAQKLGAFGYRQGTVATAANQTETSTVVAYLSGTSSRARATDRTDALHVAQALGLRRAAVQPVDQSTLQVACPGSAACTANVVVTVGADLANQ